MIVYGWGYFNRRDHSLVRDVCRACGRPGYLRSYTSSKFFTLYFIPVIPLGREKIVHECPHCQKAFGMSLGKWRKLQRTDLPKALAAFDAKPADPEAARAVLGACIGLQDTATLLRVGPQIRSTFARDAAVLGLLAGAYSYLCLDKEADAVYLDATALSADADLAAQANAHLELQRLAKPKPPNRLLQSLPVLIVPAILLFIALGYLQKAVTGGIDHGYLVNGLERPYTVVLNGEPMRLRPHAAVRIEAIEPGRNELAPGADAAGLFEAQNFHVKVGLWDRMFARTMAVVNPDRAGVISWEKNGYAYPKAPDDSHEVRVRTGEVVHVFQDIDFEFAEFPSQISMSGKTGIVYRTRVAELGGLPAAQLANALALHGGPDALASYLRARLHGGIEDATTIHLASRHLPQPEFLEIARREIATMPLQIEWHRAYQSRLEGTADGADLVATYRALADRHPEDSTLLYLLGRIVDDPAEYVPILEKAARMPTPSAYAANALAYHHLLEGDFGAADRWAQEATRLESGNDGFRAIRLSALYGLGDYEQAEREAGDPLAPSDMPISLYQGHIYRLVKLGREREVTAAIDRFVQRMRTTNKMNSADESFARAYLQATAAVAARNRVKFAQSATLLRGPGPSFQAAVVIGDLTRAQTLVGSDEWAAADRLLLHVLLTRAGKAGAAAAQLAQAIATLSAGTGDERRWGTWLSGGEPPSVSLAAHTCPDISSHEILMHALALKHPTHAAEYLERAKRIRWLDSYATLALDAAPAAP